jgi:hypothetical protein
MRVWALVAAAGTFALLGAGCLEKNPDYCGNAPSQYHHSCKAWDAGSDKAPGKDASTDAGDVNDATDAQDASDVSSDATDAKDAVVEKSTCTLMSCGADGGPPICDVDAGTCGACTTAAQCVAHDLALHGCDTTTGACFPCTKSPECTDLPTKPICEAHACRTCATAAECVARDSSLHGCDTASGSCFPCTKNAECTDSLARPICDKHACRGCLVDADCKGVGAEVCMEDGSCLLATDAIFAQSRTAGCPGAGTAADPYCAAKKAVDEALAGGKKAAVLVGTGIFAPISVNAAGKSVAIIARDPVALEPGIDIGTGNPNIGLLVTNGDVLVRGLEIRKGNTTAVDAEGGVIRLHRCFIHDNAEAGLIVKNAGFHVENTVFANNGGGTKANVDLEATASTIKTFRNNTVISANGVLAGIACAAAYSISDCIVYGGGVGTGQTCVATDLCATQCSGHDPKLDTSFALTAQSTACIDLIVGADGPAIDRSGTARPVGPKSDCGADELNP